MFPHDSPISSLMQDLSNPFSNTKYLNFGKNFERIDPITNTCKYNSESTFRKFLTFLNQTDLNLQIPIFYRENIMGIGLF